MDYVRPGHPSLLPMLAPMPGTHGNVVTNEAIMTLSWREAGFQNMQVSAPVLTNAHVLCWARHNCRLLMISQNQ